MVRFIKVIIGAVTKLVRSEEQRPTTSFSMGYEVSFVTKLSAKSYSYSTCNDETKLGRFSQTQNSEANCDLLHSAWHRLLNLQALALNVATDLSVFLVHKSGGEKGLDEDQRIFQPHNKTALLDKMC